MSPCLGDLKFISFSDIMDCACTISWPKRRMKCVIFVAGVVFLNFRGSFLGFPPPEAAEVHSTDRCLLLG